MTGRSLQARIFEIVETLPPAQRLVADLVVEDPESVAFGTVQAVAEAVGTSTPTVIRFANRLGFDGFGALRAAVRGEFSDRSHSAVDRVARPQSGPLFERSLAVEVGNIERTFATLDEADVERAADLLDDDGRRIFVLASTQMSGLGSRLFDELALCRDRVVHLDGGEFRVATMLARLQAGDVLITLDVQRHEAWLVRLQCSAVERGAVPLAVTDRLPCSFDLTGGMALTFATDTTNIFESQVGALVLANVLVSALVDRRRPRLKKRLAGLESTWVSERLFAD